MVGGLEKLVITVGKPFKDLQALIEGYGDLELAEREERLERALELLGEAEARDSKKSKNKRSRNWHQNQKTMSMRLPL